MLINSTLNKTVNATIDLTVQQHTDYAWVNQFMYYLTYAFTYLGQVFFPVVWLRIQELVLAPYHNPQMIWIVIPLATTLLLMEFYFGRYIDEELGWNTAFGNSIVLLFVSLDLLRFLYGDVSKLATIFSAGFGLPAKTVIALAIGVLGILLMFFNFFHFLPKKLAFWVSSALPINLVAYISLSIVYSKVTIDIFTLFAAIGMYIGLIIFFGLIHLIEPVHREKTFNLIFRRDPKEVEEVEEALEIEEAPISPPQKSENNK